MSSLKLLKQSDEYRQGFVDGYREGQLKSLEALQNVINMQINKTVVLGSDARLNTSQDMKGV